ncbi:MAG TPA: DUF5652 family protein [bacterium]|nr:DUF5652 family protein [bacterium]
MPGVPLWQPFPLRAFPPGVLPLIVVWTLVWKGLALWRAARAGQTGWFVVLLLVNTLGLLEIVYLLFVAERAAPPISTGSPFRGPGPSSESSTGGGADARP